MFTSQHDSEAIPLADKTPMATVPEVEEDKSAEATSYPAPLAVFFLITAISVSNVLVSLDRTIITTVGE